jgi:hypothetical protein
MPKYMLNSLGSNYKISNTSLAFDVNEVQTTLIRIEMETQNKISFVRNIARGQIHSV